MGIDKPKVGFFPGVFDFVHAGHVRAFREAKWYCDKLIVGILVKPIGKEAPIMSVEERQIMIEGNRYVDGVVIYQSEEELQAIDKILDVDVRFRGFDHAATFHYETKAKFIDIIGDGRFHSSDIRKRCQQSS